MSDADAIAAVEADEELRERLTDVFNARGREQGWFYEGPNGPMIRERSRSDAFEFVLGIHAGLQAAGLPGFHGMELTVAAVRGADFIFPIKE